MVLAGASPTPPKSPTTGANAGTIATTTAAAAAKWNPFGPGPGSPVDEGSKSVTLPRAFRLSSGSGFPLPGTAGDTQPKPTPTQSLGTNPFSMPPVTPVDATPAAASSNPFAGNPFGVDEAHDQAWSWEKVPLKPEPPDRVVNFVPNTPLGMEITSANTVFSGAKVIKVFPGYLADKSGVCVGDSIVATSDVITHGHSKQAIVAMLPTLEAWAFHFEAQDTTVGHVVYGYEVCSEQAWYCVHHTVSIKTAQHLDSRCVLLATAPTKTRLESSFFNKEGQ